jgi:hypothetical protein
MHTPFFSHSRTVWKQQQKGGKVEQTKSAYYCLLTFYYDFFFVLCCYMLLLLLYSFYIKAFDGKIKIYDFMQKIFSYFYSHTHTLYSQRKSKEKKFLKERIKQCLYYTVRIIGRSTWFLSKKTGIQESSSKKKLNFYTCLTNLAISVDFYIFESLTVKVKVFVSPAFVIF